MFENSLVESAGRIRTHSRRYVAATFMLESAFVAAMILIPYLCPAALPARFLRVPLIAPPPPPAAPAMIARHEPRPALPHPIILIDPLTAPSRIPTRILSDLPPTLSTGPDLSSETGGGPQGAFLPGALPPPAPRVEPARPRGPVRVSAGVAAGQLIAPIRPVYPAIARETGTQGTVVVQATISKSGAIENPRIVSGPPLLVNAALDAVRQARYRPFLLNGQPVEVETTINVIFRMN